MLLHPLRKDQLKALLLQGESRLTPSEQRKAIEWATAAHLMDEQGLTIEGRLVATKDPYLEATVTDWLIHFYLSSGDRSLWKYFVYEFLRERSAFTQDELLDSCTEAFASESSNQLIKYVRLLLKTYTDSQAISNTKFLVEANKRYSIGRSDLSNPYTIGYLLAKIWDRDFKAQSAVLVEQILDAEMGLGNVLGIGSEELKQQLNILAECEIIEQLSTKPYAMGTKPRVKEDSEPSYQICRCWETATELLEKAYENDIATPNRPLMQSLEALPDDGDDFPDFSQFLEWATELVALEGGVSTNISLAS